MLLDYRGIREDVEAMAKRALRRAKWASLSLAQETGYRAFARACKTLVADLAGRETEFRPRTTVLSGNLDGRIADSQGDDRSRPIGSEVISEARVSTPWPD